MSKKNIKNFTFGAPVLKLLLQGAESTLEGTARAILEAYAAGITRRDAVAAQIRAVGVGANTLAIGKGVAICNAAIKAAGKLPKWQEIAGVLDQGNAAHRAHQAKHLAKAGKAGAGKAGAGKTNRNSNLNNLKNALVNPALFGKVEDIQKAIQLVEEWLADAQAIIAK